MNVNVSYSCALSVLLLVCLQTITIFVCDVNGQSSYSAPGELIFAHVIFRHGDRTPIDPYPMDPYKDRSNWPEGYGQLTNIGKQQHFALGQFFRRRYQKLLGNDGYSRDLVVVRSTDVDRTLMSVMANLAGLFPPNGNEVWSKDLQWQPIPVHTIPESLDHVLAAKQPCPLFDYTMKKLKASDEFQALDKRYKPLFEYLTASTGKKVKTITDVQNLYNTIFIEDLKNLTLPDWTHKVYPGGDMEWMAAFSFKVTTYTPVLARLKAGFLLREILDRSQQKTVAASKVTQNFWMYSAHDTTIANVLNALGVFELHSPPYRACIMFELYRVNNEYALQIFYRNTTIETPEPLYIPNCGTTCPLSKLFQLYNDILPSGDFEAECKVPLLAMTYEEADLDGFQLGSIAIVCFVVIMMLLATIIYKSYQNRNTRWYLKL